jgi:outer membrane usher protein FimD/PapC
MARPDGRARPARRRNAGGLLALAAGLALLAAPLPARCGEPSLLAALGTAAPELLVVQVVLNAERKGQFFATVVERELLLRARDLAAIGLVAARAHTRTIDGEEYVGVGSIDGVRASFDERKLVLDLVAEPRLLSKSTVDLWASVPGNVFYPTNPSAYFNYDLTFAGGDSGQPDTTSITTEFGARTGDFLFLNDATCDIATGRHRCVRLNTNLTHDDRSTLVRTIVGDVAVPTGLLGTPVNLGGISYSKLYNLDPYFIRFPQQNVSGQLKTASDIEIFVDGQRVRSMRLPAGEFDLRNITQTTGYRTVNVVIRDAFGREQRLNTSFYVTDAMLKAGLHEFSYNVGAMRENYGVESNDYGRTAFSAFHRYGLTDALTIGGRAEGVRDRFNLGPAASVILGNAGILNLAASVSDDHGQSGAAAAAAWSYAGEHWSAGLFARKDSRHYAALSDFASGNLDFEIAGNLGYTAPVWGSFSVGYATFRAYDGQDRDAVSASYSRTLFNGRASLFATLVQERAQTRTTSAFAGIIWNLDVNYSLSASYRRYRGTTSETLQFQKALPVGEGLGYTIAIERASAGDATGSLISPSFQYNGRWGTLRGYATQVDDPRGTRRAYALSAAGGVAWVENTVAVGRPVTDSFGIVKVDEAEGIPVSVNGQRIGSTDREGKVFVPTLASFIQNQVSIDTRNIPLDLSFPESVKLVSPPYRSGAVIDFHAKRLRAVEGTVEIRTNGSGAAAQFYTMTVAVDGRPVTLVTGRGGEFYVENIQPGRYAARLAANGQFCTFELVVPESAQSIVQLPTIVCEWGR